MRKISEKNIVLISEFSAPEDFKCIWDLKKKRTFNNDPKKYFDVTEKLFVYKG